MDIREIIQIDRIKSGDKPGSATKSDAFAKVLEELQGRASQSSAPVVADIGQLADAMRRAENDYSSLMDLRRKLEEAWRSHNS